jgi:hypothetical protein
VFDVEAASGHVETIASPSRRAAIGRAAPGGVAGHQTVRRTGGRPSVSGATDSPAFADQRR